MNLNLFIQKMQEIKALGFVPTHRPHDTGIGKTLEDLLGIEENNINLPDLGETGELKAYRKNSSSLLTLFTLEPKRELSWYDLLTTYGYTDEKGRRALYSTMSSTYYNAQDMKITSDGNKLYIVKKVDGTEHILGYYDKEQLTKQFKDKVGKNLVIVLADTQGSRKTEKFWYNEAYLLENFSAERFFEVVDSGDVYIDFRVHLKESGAGRSHGTGFRIKKSKLDDCYEYKKRIL